MKTFHYEIRVEGLLTNIWCDWFEGLDISHEGNLTLITLTAGDSAMLYGVMGQISSLNLKLISIQLLATNDDENILSYDLGDSDSTVN